MPPQHAEDAERPKARTGKGEGRRPILAHVLKAYRTSEGAGAIAALLVTATALAWLHHALLRPQWTVRSGVEGA